MSAINLTRRNFLKISPLAAAALLPSMPKRAPLSEEELVATLNEGDVLRVVYPDVYVDRVAPPPTEEVRFIFVTDPHIGVASRYEAGEPQSLIDYLVSLNPAFFIFNGDDSDDGSVTQLQQFVDLVATIPQPVYILPGNHDESKPAGQPPPNEYIHYDALIGTHQFAFDVLNYRLIGFTSHIKRDEPFMGYAYLDEATKTLLNAEAATLNGKTPLLFTHFPVHDVFGNNIRDWVGAGNISGQANIFNLFTQAGGGVQFTGHRHFFWPLTGNPERFPYASPVVPGLTEINGPCFAYDAGNPDGGFNLVTLTGSQIKIEAMRARPPFDKLQEVLISVS